MAEERAGKDGHRAYRREVPWVRKDAENGGDEDHRGRDEKTQQVEIAIDAFILTFHCACSFRSQNVKPSRSTTSPRSTAIDWLKIGPAKTKVWNSPFSPH